MSAVRAVLFDVDFTLARPGPELSPEGYRRLGERHGLRLRPERYDEARAGAIASLQKHPQHENFELYEDVLPVLDELRAAGLRLGLVSNTSRDLDAFVRHHALDVDAALA